MAKIVQENRVLSINRCLQEKNANFKPVINLYPNRNLNEQLVPNDNRFLLKSNLDGEFSHELYKVATEYSTFLYSFMQQKLVP